MDHPVIDIYDMAQFILQSEQFSEKLLNHPISNEEDWTAALETFWEKWRCLEPWNKVFEEHANDLAHCIPCMLHGDEGVGHRRKPIMQISWGSLLRVGKNSLQRMFMYTSCPHKLYSKYNKGAAHGNFVLDRLFKEFAKSAYKAYNGVPGKGERTFYLVFLGVAGDHPFQTKVYRSERGHLHLEICPHCLANTYSVPFEDLSIDALWRKTLFQAVPWNRHRMPPLAIMPGALDARFIRWDLMHMLPHGAVRTFVASVVCMMCGPLDMFESAWDASSSKEARLEEAYSHFQSWLTAKGSHVRDLKEFTVENLGWQQNRSFPDMTCKAADTTLLVQWLIDFISTVPFERTWVLCTALEGLEGVDEFCRLAYSSDDRLFWNQTKQRLGKCYLGAFLRAYVELAAYWHRAGWTLFKLVPKLHYSAHWHEDLRLSLEEGNAWALSPGAFSTPILEDYIGISSRISRTSHPSSVARTTIFKYLVEIRKAWSADVKR